MRSALSLVSIAVLLAACEGGGPGSPCEGDEGCRSGLGCPTPPSGAPRVCMTRCSEQDAGTFLCAEGAVCLALEGERWCWLGGRIPLGMACADDLQCEPGTFCSGGTCRQFCDTFCATTCYATQQCVANACEDLPDAGPQPDAGGENDAGRDAGVDASVVCPHVGM